jgi:hypothetical protein
MIYLVIFMFVVVVIGIVTHKLNAKPLCDHDWHEMDHTVKCNKCNKCIPKHANSNTYSEAA